MLRAILLCVLSVCVLCEESRVVHTAQGPIRGYRSSSFDGFVFHNVPYATAPTGRDKFKEPGPPPTWEDTYDAISKQAIVCPQPIIFPGQMGDLSEVQEDCLIANIYVPNVDDVLPVVVFVHGGAYLMGYGDSMTPKKMLASKKAIFITFNYRLAGHGFLCLGTEDIPGNAGLKDQVAMLRWVQKNIASFGGDPNDVTIVGVSAGSSAADLLMLSKMTKGLFNKVIPESGANTAAFSVQPDPFHAAKEYAQLLNYTGSGDIYELEEFFKSMPVEILNSVNTFSRNDATFLVGPCVERDTGTEVFLHDSPVNILKSGDYEKVPMLYGFTNMEGLVRLLMVANDVKADMERMDRNFSDYLSADLTFETVEEREKVARKIKTFYFGSKVNEDDAIDYVNYFSDVFFTFSTLRSVKYHVEAGHNEIYLYEYSFTDEYTPLIPFTKIRGANHCAQSVALWTTESKFAPQSTTKEYYEIEKTLKELWMNFMITGKPVPEGSGLPEWPAVGRKWSPHMSLGRAVELRGSLLKERMEFWEEIYARHYRSPQPPPTPPPKRTEL